MDEGRLHLRIFTEKGRYPKGIPLRRDTLLNQGKGIPLMNSEVGRWEVLVFRYVTDSKSSGANPGFNHGRKCNPACLHFIRGLEEGGLWTGNPFSHGELQQPFFVPDELNLLVGCNGEEDQ